MRSAQRAPLNIPSILVIGLGAATAVIAAIGVIFTFIPPLWALMEQLLKLVDPHPPSVGAIRGLLAWLTFTGSLLIGGGWYLREGRSMAIAVATCFGLALPCCTSSFCCFGVPLAIWVFLVLMRRDVRDSFD